MITTLLVDFARVLVLPKDETIRSVNKLYKQALRNQEKFNQHFYVNEELFEYLESIKDSFNMYLFTGSTDLLELPILKSRIDKLFRDVYITKVMGMNKRNIEIYRLVLDRIKISPDEIMFIDDKARNIRIARLAGLNTHHFTVNRTLIDEINMLK
ncbi:MAG: HAD-IA family hydrolase [Candidatus Dojkabacteria bacterium]